MCSCNEGFKGADCSEKLEMLIDGYQGAFSMNGTQWVYFQLNTSLLPGESYLFTLQSQYMMDIYVVTGTIREPTEFSNDLEFKQQTTVSLSS